MPTFSDRSCSGGTSFFLIHQQKTNRKNKIIAFFFFPQTGKKTNQNTPTTTKPLRFMLYFYFTPVWKDRDLSKQPTAAMELNSTLTKQVT